MAHRGRVHLLLEHALVDRADRVFRPSEHLRAHRFRLPERELRNRMADASLDPFGAKCDLVLAGAFTPFLRPVRVSDRHAHDGDGGMDAAQRHDPRNAPTGADDDAAADLLPQDPVGRSHVVLSLRRHRRSLEPEAVVANGLRGVVDDAVGGLPALFEREVEARQRELQTDDVGRKDAQRGLEQLLPGLVSFQHHHCSRIHGAGDSRSRSRFARARLKCRSIR